MRVFSAVQILLPFLSLGLAFRIEDLWSQTSYDYDYDVPRTVQHSYNQERSPTRRQDGAVELDTVLPVFLVTLVASSVVNFFSSALGKSPDDTPATPDLFNPDGCGVANPDVTRRRKLRKNKNKKRNKDGNRVTGGQDADDNQFPWQCGILDSNNEFTGCGATLISCEGILVTAASCFNGTLAQIDWAARSPLRVSCGAISMVIETAPGSGVYATEAPLDPAEERHRIVKQEDIVVHPDFDETTGENDI